MNSQTTESYSQHMCSFESDIERFFQWYNDQTEQMQDTVKTGMVMIGNSTREMSPYYFENKVDYLPWMDLERLGILSANKFSNQYKGSMYELELTVIGFWVKGLLVDL